MSVNFKPIGDIKMKKIIINGTMILLPLSIILFCLTAFYYTTFDITKWDESGRALCVIMEWGIIIISYVISGAIESTEKQ